jgi:hypothetical protein
MLECYIVGTKTCPAFLTSLANETI